MKSWLSFIICIIISIAGYAQDSIAHRIIFIGDALGRDAEEQRILNHALNNVVAGRTSVIYSDESPYLRGKIQPGSNHAKTIQQNWESQYRPMRTRGANVYFFPGNHEWNKTAAKEMEKFKWIEQYFSQLPDSMVKLIYGRSCPEPVTVDLGDNAVIVFFNSEWWLLPQNNVNTDKECECRTKLDVLARLDEIRFRNRHRLIIVASHHPFQSYGIHDGKYTAEDHLFPLTSINKNLYVPLPGVGSIYCFFRSAFSGPNDVKHPLHKDMVKNVDRIFQEFPNLIHIASHEPGLQLIKSDEMQVVSGTAAKHLKTKKGKRSLYANNSLGYAVVDILTNNNVRLSFFTGKKNSVSQSFTYQQSYTSIADELAAADTLATADSAIVRVHPSYNEKRKFHKFFFGENYRKEWAAPTKLPVIRVSEFRGGLVPLTRGGGMQSQSLRLADKEKREWVIRSVEKSPDALLPDEFRPTFARDWLDDATSAQHPFSAMIVPPIANAVQVPHSVPVIGVIAPDKNLGIYERTFSNMVALVEEREPLGASDNTAKMKTNLQDDNDNDINAKEFLNARMLDMLLGDWDRHEDQWRWKDMSKGKSENYVGIPRDRDQVFHVTQGIIPKMASRDYVLPTLRNFDPNIDDVKWVLFKTRFVNAYPQFQFSRAEWKEQAEKFRQAVTDSVIQLALNQLPQSSYQLRYEHLYKNLRSRRDKVPEVMDQYYRFIQKIADIQTSDKDEFVQITDGPDGGINIRISKIDKDGNLSKQLMNKTYERGLTKEVRLFVRNGNDSIVINNQTSNIKLRLIGGDNKKSYNVIASKNRVNLYDKQNNSAFYGDAARLKKHISDDSLNTAFVPVNLYNIWMPIVLFGLNFDDGFLVSAGFRHIRQEGFRKSPYASMHQFQAGYYFSTGAYRMRYTGEWLHTLGKADFTLRATANAPNNTTNFFGLGNESVYEKTGDHKRYYRTRFSTYLVDPAIRFRKSARSSFSIGPALYVYFFNQEDNKGRFIENEGLIGSYDSVTVEKEKWHVGLVAEYTRDKRSNIVFPQWGTYINVKLQAYNGVNDYAKSFAQLSTELAMYKGLNPRSTIVVAERIGGVIGFGEAAFYQSAYIGGHENLLGYRQYRFAGKHSFYNNFELRIKLADIASYIIPGQFGIRGLWDIGRVWVKDDNSSKWHNGIGGGIYFAPASVVALSFVVAHSGEGLYPYFTMGLRF